MIFLCLTIVRYFCNAPVTNSNLKKKTKYENIQKFISSFISSPLPFFIRRVIIEPGDNFLARPTGGRMWAR